MLTSYLLSAAAVALVAGVNAQDSTGTTATGSSTATSSGSSSTGTPKSQIIEISVGAELHKFSPDSVTANVGDTIRFNFYPGGHRVARAEFKQSCIPYEYTGPNKKGFWSGIYNPQVITVPAPHYDIKVNDTETIFFYCGAPGSCNQYGMVGVINPTKEKTLEIQKEFASNSTLQLVPGEPFPSETLKPIASATATPPPGSSNDGSSGQNNGSQSSKQESSGLGAGAIAGIAIGAAAVLVIGAGIIYLCGRRGGFERAYQKGQHPADGHHSMAEARYHDPKSPGQHTVTTFAGSERDPYRVSAQTPLTGHFAGTPPPPGSPGLNGFGAYQPPIAPNQHYDAASQHQQQQQQQQQHGYYSGMTSPHPMPSPQFQSPPSELPAAEHHPTPGHSPPPQYPSVERRDSYTAGVSELNYGSKPK